MNTAKKYILIILHRIMNQMIPNMCYKNQCVVISFIVCKKNCCNVGHMDSTVFLQI